MIVSDLIRRALWAAGVIRRDDEPASKEYDDYLIEVQAFYEQLIASGMLGRVTEVLISADYATTYNRSERISNAEDTAYTVTLPETLTDAQTGDTIKPRDYSLVVIAGPTPQYYVFNALKGAWDRMSSLALTDYAPLSERGPVGLAAAVAMQFVGPGGLSATTVQNARAFRSALSLKFDRPREEAEAAYF